LTKIPQLSSIVNGLKERFEFIVVDAPPVFPLADMNLLAALADMLLFVVRAEGTPADVVKKALKSLKPIGRAGIILTASRQELGPRYALNLYAPSMAGNIK
jgi:Mrp family chromosome partitioning ATPase